MSKSEKTTQFIIDKVAPIFNKNGYEGTSLKHITEATKLTKGAIYGNFKNKEDLALACFNTLLKRIIEGLKMRIHYSKSPLEKLYKIVEFYNEYYNYTEDIGGCPILNTGVDSAYQNNPIQERVRDIIIKLQNEFAKIIDEAIKEGQIKASTNSFIYAKRIFTLIQGGIFMSSTMKDDSYMNDATKRIELLINTELIK